MGTYERKYIVQAHAHAEMAAIREINYTTTHKPSLSTGKALQTIRLRIVKYKLLLYKPLASLPLSSPLPP
jgi:hypothetical protein